MACCCTCIGVWLAVTAVIAYFFLIMRSRKQIRKRDWKPDTVYLYQFPRTRTIPNLSPFCLKVEAFLKANKIPYEVCPILVGRSQYGLLPFIELNGEHIADSQIIIRRLEDHFKIKPLSSPKEEAIARAVDRMADNHSFFVLNQFKAYERTNDFFSMASRSIGLPEVLVPIAAWFIRKRTVNRVAACLGRYSVDEFRMLLKSDFDTYRDLIGDKKFLFGDEITKADCTLFSHLAITLYIPSNCEAKETLKENYPSLVAYGDRIRDTVFGKEFAED